MIDRPRLEISNFAGVARELQSWINQESVVHVDDLVLRRSDVTTDVQLPLARWLAESRSWPTPSQDQVKRLKTSTI